MARLSLKQETIEAFAATATQNAAMIQRRVSQKRNKVIDSVPLLKTVKDKIIRFDQKMTDRFKNNYTKIRNMVMGIGKYYIAGQIGGPALVALGTYNAVKALKPMFREAEQQRKEGKVTGVIDFIKKNRKEAAKTMLFASLGAAVVACGLTGAVNGKLIARTGIAALVITPEIKALTAVTKKWVKGTAKPKDILREAATVGLSIGAYLSGSGWGHHDTSLEHHGAASVSYSGEAHGISVPISKADKAPKENLQQILLNHDRQKSKNETLITAKKRQNAER